MRDRWICFVLLPGRRVLDFQTTADDPTTQFAWSWPNAFKRGLP